MENEKYLIWSIGHDAWWAPGFTGYTHAKKSAGRYTEDQANQILEDANIFSIQEMMIPDA